MELREKLSDRNTQISLFGELESVLPVAQRISKFYKKVNYLTVYKDEIKLQSLSDLGIQSIMYEMDCTKQWGFVVVCSFFDFSRLDSLLQCAGLVPYKDYVSSCVVDAFLSGKKLMVCMGTQMIEQVCNVMRSNSKIMEQVDIVYFPVREFWRDMRSEYIHAGRVCDIHLVSVFDRNGFKLSCLPNNTLPEGCREIKLGDFGFRGIFPQIFPNVELTNPYLLRVHDRDDSMDYETVVAAKIDTYIESRCEKAADISEETIERIVEELMDVNLVDQVQIEEHYREEVERWKSLEEEFEIDIRIGEQLEVAKHYSQLNRSVNEWNESIICYLVERIVEMLGLETGVLSSQEIALVLAEKAGSDLPVYPCVQVALGMQDELKDKLYRLVTFKGIKYMPLKDYLRYLVEYTLRAVELFRYTEADKKLEADWEERTDALGAYFEAKREKAN